MKHYIEGSWATGVVNYKEEGAAALHPGIHFLRSNEKRPMSRRKT